MFPPLKGNKLKHPGRGRGGEEAPGTLLQSTTAPAPSDARGEGLLVSGGHRTTRPPHTRHEFGQATGDQKAVFALYLSKCFVCSHQLGLAGAFSAPTSTELETTDSKGIGIGGRALQVRVAACVTQLPTLPLGRL